jgi:hypothetical protein
MDHTMQEYLTRYTEVPGSLNQVREGEALPYSDFPFFRNQQSPRKGIAETFFSPNIVSG